MRVLAAILAAPALALVPGSGTAAQSKPVSVTSLRPTWRLIDPHVIVIHYTESSTF